jgi:hypothetical protein
MPRGRRPLPEGRARTERFTTRLRPAGAEEFRAVCAALGKDEAEGLRDAMADYTAKHKNLITRSST